MDIERALISKVISTGQFEEVVSRGIRADFFADRQCQDMFLFLADHVRRYKVAPSVSAVRQARPDFEQLIASDPLDYLIDEFIVKVKRHAAQRLLISLGEIVNDREKSRDIELHFMEISRTLSTMLPATETHNFARDMEQRIKDYEERVARGEQPGIPFGFPTLDRWTGGIQPHEFVTVVGASGLGKSTFLIATAFNAWMNGKTPLYISLEMEKHAIARKFDAMFAGIEYNKIKHLNLPEDQLERWRQKVREAKSKNCDIPIIDSIRGCTPDHVFAETVRHNPDIIFIDYLSLMRSSRPNSGGSLWQTITEITQDLKQNARTLRVPIMAAAQTNRSGYKDGGDLENVGYSNSIVQDSDIIIGLHADDDMKRMKRMEIRLRKNRDGRLGQFQCIWDHDKTEYREFREGEELRQFFRDDEPKENEEKVIQYENAPVKVTRDETQNKRKNPFIR